MPALDLVARKVGTALYHQSFVSMNIARFLLELSTRRSQAIVKIGKMLRVEDEFIIVKIICQCSQFLSSYGKAWLEASSPEQEITFCSLQPSLSHDMMTRATGQIKWSSRNKDARAQSCLLI